MIQSTGPQALIAAAQNITDSWVDLGGEIPTAWAQTAGLWLNVDINNGANVRVRALAKHTADGDDEYSLPIRTAGASDIKVEVEYIEFNVDGDQKVMVSFTLGGVVPYVQFQVSAGTVGSPTAAQIDSAYVTLATL